jgi:hypothetical protein
MIISIEPSPKRNKRYRVQLDDGRTYDFGQKSAQTFIDHHDETKRSNYWARHFANRTEKRLITELQSSPALFSAMLLWGRYTKLEENIKYLNQLFDIQRSNK